MDWTWDAHTVITSIPFSLDASDDAEVVAGAVSALAARRDLGLRVVRRPVHEPRDVLLFRPLVSEHRGGVALAMLPGNKVRDRLELSGLPSSRRHRMREAGWVGPRRSGFWWSYEFATRRAIRPDLIRFYSNEEVRDRADDTPVDYVLETWDCYDLMKEAAAEDRFPSSARVKSLEYGMFLDEYFFGVM